MTRLMTLQDAAEMERRYGVAYFVTTDRRTCLPATHVGPDRLGHVWRSDRHDVRGCTVYWKVYDASGKLLLHGYESAFSNAPARKLRAWRRAVEAVHSCGAEIRVRPGDRGPWGPASPEGL